MRGCSAASALILFGAIYWATGIYMANSLDAAIDSDITELEDAFQVGGKCRIGGRSGNACGKPARPNVLFA